MRQILLIVLTLLSAFPAFSQSREGVRKSTDVLCLVPAAAAVTATLVQKDYKGLGQFALGEGAALATNYLLELCIRKERPDCSGHHAFPSTHTAVAFAASTYIGRRYGWKWSIPAYLVSAYVGFGRVYAKKHDTWDVLAGAAIGVGAGYFLTRKHKKNVTMAFSPYSLDGNTGVTFSAVF